MGFLDRLFGGGGSQEPTPKQPSINSIGQPAKSVSRQLPSNVVAEGLGEVNVATANGITKVEFTVLMEPGEEGWQTGVALDASASMQGLYGRLLEGTLPSNVKKEFVARGLMREVVQDGQRRLVVSAEAVAEGLRLGHYRFTDNQVEPVARKFLAYLAERLDADGGTSLAYWACGATGADVEEVGDVRVADCSGLQVSGPSKHEFGNGTKLLPAVKWFANKFSSDTRAIAIIVTDGRCDDLEAVKAYTRELAIAIERKQRAFIKLVLIGIGDEIDEHQMEQLDDLETGTGVDIWDHKVERDMRALAEIFAELVDENTIVASSARIYAADGTVVKDFPDGMPAKVSFTMPAHLSFFEIDIEGTRIKQLVSGY